MQTKQPDMQLGRVFTPFSWAEWCLETFGIYQAWQDGATIIEPTCGNGVFFRSLIRIAKRRGGSVSPSLLKLLFGVEIVHSDKESFLQEVFNLTGMYFPEKNYISSDFLLYNSNRTFDIAIGNPPWVNFTNLPTEYKSFIKIHFEKYGLVKKRQNVLLGASRIDIAAVIIKKCMSMHVKEGGYGYFFVPLSLFFNESANAHFRPCLNSDNVFSVAEIIDFPKNIVFPSIKTRNGFVCLVKSNSQISRISYREINKSNGKSSKSFWCFPSYHTGAWKLSKDGNPPAFLRPIKVNKYQKPRQGINTCGLNNIFIFQAIHQEKSHLSVTTFCNGLGEEVELSTEYMLPIVHAGLFGRKKSKQQKYILCLYHTNGKPLNWLEIKKLHGISEYLDKYKKEMINRKGVLIRNQISRGIYWSLLGVGDYTFKKWKVLWEAMGKKDFQAIVIDGNWQGNQAMHAYISSNCLEDANRIKNELNDNLPNYLQSFGMQGTCNWAQPSRIKELLSFTEDKGQLSLI
ncbi:Eco57I restriction-modification methylase domain-containing protein [Candidatus Synechococcus spongiarum]|uniref:Eco57I restriction-modification methylase domain-containing protein n=1 Tax=Candidatus Synechococcus spongiarum TaxID=431041 RepID=UPI001C5AA009|nr:hypothetical protein [Candidatus Synechococcus spongiarum]